MRARTTMVVICGALMVFISMGTRQSFGLFLQPVSEFLGSGRAVFSLAVAIQNLVFGLPLVGLAADRFGPREVAAAGGLIYAAGLLMLSGNASVVGLYLSLGLVTGLALSSTSYVVVLGAAARVTPPHKRGAVFGLITAAGSLGMFAVVQGVRWQVSVVGWQETVWVLAVFVALTILLAAGFPGRTHGEEGDSSPGAVPSGTMVQTLDLARRHSGYWLLNAGFFVCGFHVAFIATHLPAYLTDQGLSAAAGATALSLIGLFNIGGSWLFGLLGDRYRKKYLLSVLYFLRAVVITLFLALPLSEVSAALFGAAIGFLWLATVPLTSGMVAHIFGSRYLSTLYGIVFFSHQLGSFLGVWLGGRLYDMTQSYTVVWVAAVALGVAAAVVHLPITDRPAVMASAVKPAPLPAR